MTDAASPDPQVLKQGDDIPSPCVNVCTLHPLTGLCLGCYRTLEEIAGWRDYSATEKRAVLARLPVRRRRQGD